MAFGTAGQRVQGRGTWWGKNGAREHQDSTCWTDTCKYDAHRPLSLEQAEVRARLIFCMMRTALYASHFHA